MIFTPYSRLIFYMRRKRQLDYMLVSSLPLKINFFIITSKRLLKNRNQTFPVVRYLTWKLEFVAKILSMIVSRNSFVL